MKLNFRTIWISDTHLGGKNLKSEKLYNFLQHTESESLYLVGDIVDLWALKRSWYWPSINDQIMDLIFQKAKNGTRVIYLPGNHDDALRRYIGSTFNGVEVHNEIVHYTKDGSKYLVLHGDKFDNVVQEKEWLANIGSCLYDILLVINRFYNRYRTIMGKDYFSISSYLKQKCKKVVNYMGNYEDVLIKELQQQKVDGIVCGHIHHATIKSVENFLYTNSGDWVESCTALAENHNGTMGIIQWVEQNPVTETMGSKEHETNLYNNRCLAPTN